MTPMQVDSSFASDNAAGAHPEVIDAIVRANVGFATAYGHDAWSETAEAQLRRHFGADAEPLIVFGGTGANIVALAPLREAYHAVVCAQTSHLWNDECGAPERFLGSKLIPVGSTDGKLTPEAVRRAVPERAAVHHAQPRVLSIAQPTELGTVYSIDELAALTALARERGWRVHVDGARLANAAAALGEPLGAFGRPAGVDAISFGVTKNGGLAAEAVVLFDAELRARADYYRKQAAQLASKHRFAAAQITALLEGDLWQRCADHANRMAQRLAAAVEPLVAYPVDTNAVFLRMSDAAIAELRKSYALVVWDAGLVRAMTSWNTQPDDVDRFALTARRAAGV